MAKRVFLFLATNLAIILTLSIVLSLLEMAGVIQPGRYGLQQLAIFCFVWGMGGSFLSLQMSRWIAKRSTGLQLVDGRTGNETLDWLHVTVARLAEQSQLPLPEVGVYESGEVNAFATGPSRRRSLVAVSTGLLRSMSRREAEAVLAHEVAHIRNGDMVTMALLQGVLNAFVMFFARVIGYAIGQVLSSRDEDGESPGLGFFAQYLIIIVLEIAFGLLASLITAWFSRRREFRADRGGAELAGREGMVAALRRLMQHAQAVDPSHQALATFKINNRRSWMVFFSTHPPLEARIAALEAGR